MPLSRAVSSLRCLATAIIVHQHHANTGIATPKEPLHGAPALHETLDGIKNSLNLEAVTGEVTNKFNAAKDFASSAGKSVIDAANIQSLRDKVGSFGQGVTNLVPASWAKHFPAASGVRQSPIDIQITMCEFDQQIGSQIQFNYNADLSTLENNGITLVLSAPEGSTSSVRVGFLPDEYRLLQVHAHWGTESHNGSEHTIDGLGYAGEIHLVHYNTKYGNKDEAAKHPDGFLVLAIFLDEGLSNNALTPVFNNVHKVAYKGDTVPLGTGLSAKSLIPDKIEFWTYEGSLTQAPFTECVIWVVFRSTIPIGPQQLEKLRSTLHAVGVEDAERNPQKLSSNVRSSQPIHGRKVRCSFFSPKCSNANQPAAQ